LDILRKSRTVHHVDLDFKKRGTDKNLLFISDVHYDSVKCDRSLLHRHLEEARRIGAGVFIFGDLFDLMQGRFDPRGNYSELRPEYKSCTYVDEVIQDVGEKLAEYKDVIRFIARGNHETNIEKRMMVSPIDRVAQIINAAGGRVETGGYAGWLGLTCHRGGKSCKRFLVHYHHGYGGNAKRSKGVLNNDLDLAQFPDADFIVRGHDHNKWYHPVTVDRINQKLKLEQSTRYIMRLGSYKKLGDRFAGWATEKGFNTPTLGGWWVRFVENRDVYRVEVRDAS